MLADGMTLILGMSPMCEDVGVGDGVCDGVVDIFSWQYFAW